MTVLTQPLDAEELAHLTRRWGAAPVEHCHLEVDTPFLTREHQRLLSDGRRAEICYVMIQEEISAGLLLHTKHIYPPGAYRLPTGGVHPGHTVLETLAREVYEETGLVFGDAQEQLRLEGFLGVVAYEFHHKTLGQRFPFATYHFLVRMPSGAVLQVQDPSEEISDWRWCPLTELPAVAESLASLGERVPAWGDWGRFRALSHHFVARHLRP
ncbi:NUDIX hydrolase [Litorilinea aerophila]|uniref:NUDIX hydrolase n=1 Tax=Litorilinea aerophila TaxID=1204385 RepID=A0A540VM60_9CHLR|nr:NUDIX hydrolase [Litorilinea aerophila]MCC9074541.1 NUDIX hydrolase [Litorilinea aerophila]OUC06231.1 hypothetical protein RY27_22310 [Litorilinea aerophila]GIV75689.1 MAG: NUDIX hydrolase [Litorilinea sp.]